MDLHWDASALSSLKREANQSGNMIMIINISDRRIMDQGK